MTERPPEKHNFDEEVISPIVNHKKDSRVRKNRSSSAANPVISESAQRQLDSIRPVETEVEARLSGEQED